MFEFRFPPQKIEDFHFPPCKNCTFPLSAKLGNPPSIASMTNNPSFVSVLLGRTNCRCDSCSFALHLRFLPRRRNENSVRRTCFNTHERVGKWRRSLRCWVCVKGRYYSLIAFRMYVRGKTLYYMA